MSCGGIQCTKHILHFLVLTSIVVPIYQSGKVIYENLDSDLLDVSQMGSLKKQPSDNARLCEKSGMENGPHGDLDGCFSWGIGFGCDSVGRREVDGNDFVGHLAREAGPETDCVGRIAREAGPEADCMGRVAREAGPEADCVGRVAREAGPEADCVGHVAREASPEADCAGHVAREVGPEADCVRRVAREAGPEADCVGRLAREAYFGGARVGGTLSGKRG